jgi:hypothetical protein
VASAALGEDQAAREAVWEVPDEDQGAREVASAALARKVSPALGRRLWEQEL